MALAGLVGPSTIRADHMGIVDELWKRKMDELGPSKELRVGGMRNGDAGGMIGISL